ncbi:2-oxoglutarate-Fe(II) type oxidoreductase hxnY isoform X3 [Euphorbia lathyris]|uniref:2-oxoglutarate-Fe(II) type oxidoreductase hxnY isoform X3 n=1 Tax=Euphorbia lathyris TaxID=212925 RepID=UPI003313A620
MSVAASALLFHSQGKTDCSNSKRKSHRNSNYSPITETMESEKQQDSCPLQKFSVLNCIDLSSSDIDKSVSSLKQACLDSGFFYVINHGISQEFMEEVFAESKKFFELPLVEKMKVLRNEKHRGYTPMLDEILDPDNQVHVGDYKEGYYMGVEVSEDDAAAEKPFYGPNVWPADDLLPGWRETMERFRREGLEVARKVARIIALALDLEADFFDRPEMLGEPIAIMRLLHYGAQISDPSSGIFGAGAHSDYGLITLLATDDVSGLQICKDKDARPQVWEYIEPLKGAFIVNLGDMLERWSNCIFSCIRGHLQYMIWHLGRTKMIFIDHEA